MKSFYINLIFVLMMVGFHARADIFIEGESGNLSGTAFSSANGGYTGTGYVGSFDNPGDKVTWTFNVSSAGLYEIFFRYNSPFSAKNYDLQVNAEVAQPTFIQTGTWSVSSGGKYYLPAGQNTIIVSTGWGYYDIDNINLVPAVINPPFSPAANLADGNATPATRSLYNYMKSLYGNKILSGQEDDIQYVIDVTGREPAIGGFDLMDYSPSRIEKSGYVPSSSESNIAWATKGANRGMISLVWHWNAPTDLIDQPGKEWWRGFYTDASTFDVQAALADKSSWRYSLLLRDIDAIAAQLQKYNNANIPVLWRPLHEAHGGWFWWGAKGAGAFKELWQIMYDRLVNYNGLHNLIWVYTGDTDPNWFPGNAYVDVVSLDIYGNVGASMSVDWDGMQNFLQSTNTHKMVALSETGNLPDPDKVRAYGTWWSWYANWPGEYLTGQDHAVLQKMFWDNDVITLDELPDWRNFGGGVQSPYAGVINLPGVIEAENFDNGGEGVSYHDVDPQNRTGALRNEGVDVEGSSEGYYDLCYSENGEWTEYTVNVTQSGNYAIDTRVASLTGGSFHLEMNGLNITGSLGVPATGGWQTWSWVHKEVALNAGVYVMRFYIEQSGFNTNGFVFSFLTGSSIVSGQTYRLLSRNSNQALDVNSCSLSDGANVQQWPSNGANCQRWTIESTDGGFYRLTSVQSGKALDVEGCSVANGANVQQWPYWGGACQQWSVEPTDAGYFRLVSRESGQVLEVGDALTTNGANVRQWPWNGATCQQWKIENVNTLNLRTAQADEQNISPIAEKSFSSVFIYPNPGNTEVNIDGVPSYNEDVQVTIITMQGQTVLSNSFAADQVKLSTTSLPSGMYMIVLKTSQGSLTERLVILH